MSIFLDCPRCKNVLSLADKKAGGEVNCPECGGRFRLAERSGQSSAGQEKRRTAADADRAATPRGNGHGGNGAATGSPSPACNTPPPRVARFIAIEPMQSTLTLREDNTLPEMHLDERGKASAKEHGSGGRNSLVLSALLTLSVAASLALLLMPSESSGTAKGKKKDQSRQVIQREYFHDIDSPEPRHPYQRLLRLAQQARVRGDFRQERALYRQVLDLLRCERGKFDKGATGSRDRDRRLEEHILTILSN